MIYLDGIESHLRLYIKRVAYILLGVLIFIFLCSPIRFAGRFRFRPLLL